jgi:UDP-2,3-diacylglucosamine pyrophosphatase LpxH
MVVLMGKILAVSDTHFGHEESKWRQFEDFLEVLKQGKLIARLYDKTEIHIKNIDKFILIGDIFEMWDPKHDKRMNILLNSVSSVKKLLELNTEIIYVIGNHDEEMHMYEDDRYLNEKIKIIGNYKLERKENNSSGTIGEYSYYFMHGHQFDKAFRFVGNFWRIPGLMASLDTLWQRIPFMRAFCIYIFPLMLALILLDRCIIDFYSSSLPYFLLILSWVVAIPAYWTQHQMRLYTVARAVSEGIRSIFGRISERLDRYLKEPSSIGTAKYRTIAELVSQGYYNKEIEPEPDVIVFGHTHEPEHVILYDDNLTPRKILINTGSWMMNEGNLYTLVYIDTDNNQHYLLKWDDTNKRLREFFNIRHIKESDGSYIHRQELQ